MKQNVKFNGQNTVFHGISIFMSDGIDSLTQNILVRLKQPVVMIGMMGAGKTKIGRMLAKALGLGFIDSDDEIEKAAGCSIPDIFEHYGEKAFRDGECKVIQRLLNQEGVRIISTGGGAVFTEETADTIWNQTISIWVKADISVILERTSRNDRRPLLQTENPEKTITKMVEDRYPVYQKADIVVESHSGPVQAVLNQAMEKLYQYLLDRK